MQLPDAVITNTLRKGKKIYLQNYVQQCTDYNQTVVYICVN